MEAVAITSNPVTSSPPANRERDRLPEIQILRALAACLVVIEHTKDMWMPAGISWVAPGWTDGLGAWGVDIFFVISGFIITQSVWKKGRPVYQASDFAFRRWARIAPPYWFWSAVAFVWLSLRATSFSASAVAKTITLIPIFDRTEFILPILFVGWTLAYEAAFYLVVTVALLFKNPSPRGILSVCLLLGGFSVLASSRGAIIQFWLNPMWYEFAAGIAIALNLERLRKWPRSAGIALALIALSSWLASSRWTHSLAECLLILNQTLAWSRVVSWGMPAALMVTGGLVSAASGTKLWLAIPGVALGNASYSWYLTQLITLPLAARIWRMFVHYNNAFIFTLFAIIGSAGFALLATRYIEQPLCRACLGFSRRQPRAPASFDLKRI